MRALSVVLAGMALALAVPAAGPAAAQETQERALHGFESVVTPEGVAGEREMTAVQSVSCPSTTCRIYLAYARDPEEVRWRSGTGAYVSLRSPETGRTASVWRPRNYAEARTSRRSDGKTGCSVILPHEFHTRPNPVDAGAFQGSSTRVLRPGQTVYFRWWREVYVSGANEPLQLMTPLDSLVVPRYLTLAAMGDSYGSGEGAPHTDIAENPTGSRYWDGDCHYSQWSGLRNGIRDFMTVNRHVAVRYNAVPCSGAEIAHLISENWHGQLPQIRQLERWLDANDFPLDGVVLSIGGNDMGFGQLISDCVMGNCLNNSDVTGNDGYIARALRELPDDYAALNAAIRSRLAPRAVFLTEYPDPLRDASGNPCPSYSYLSRPDCYSALDQTLSGTESRWLIENALTPLNGAGAAACQANGWIRVNGLAAASRTRGVCTCTWFNTFKETWLRQGDYKGWVHPYRTGYDNIYRNRVQQALSARFAARWRRSDATLTALRTRGDERGDERGDGRGNGRGEDPAPVELEDLKVQPLDEFDEESMERPAGRASRIKPLTAEEKAAHEKVSARHRQRAKERERLLAALQPEVEKARAEAAAEMEKERGGKR